MRNECDECGLSACDIPDGVDPDLIFESNGRGRVYCQGCASQQSGEIEGGHRE